MATLTAVGADVARSVVSKYRASVARQFIKRFGDRHECLITELEGIAGS
jgi:hypothetical protein